MGSNGVSGCRVGTGLYLRGQVVTPPLMPTKHSENSAHKTDDTTAKGGSSVDTQEGSVLDLLKIVLEFVRALIWPGLIVGCLWFFHEPITAMLEQSDDVSISALGIDVKVKVLSLIHI